MRRLVGKALCLVPGAFWFPCIIMHRNFTFRFCPRTPQLPCRSACRYRSARRRRWSMLGINPAPTCTLQRYCCGSVSCDGNGACLWGVFPCYVVMACMCSFFVTGCINRWGARTYHIELHMYRGKKSCENALCNKELSQKLRETEHLFDFRQLLI